MMLDDPAIEALLSLLEHKVSERVNARLAQFMREFDAAFEKRVGEALARRIYLPPLPAAGQADRPFMPYSTCSTADFLHPRYGEICAMLGKPPIYHRKVWEWVFIIHKLLAAGVVGPGRRGIAFGVGQEKLPALFAALGAEIVATDAPPDVETVAGWRSGNQYSQSLDQLRYPDLIDDESFAARVSHRFCDMRAIADDLVDFDFTWSSCSFEHLGSLAAGADFVIASVENTLKIGGVACHTTEFNLSSNDETVSEGPTVLYRARDIVELVDRLRQRGHEVEPFTLAPDSHFLDFHVDAPPYTHKPHAKLRIGDYVATSVGIVVRRGR